jgi:cysteine synthase
LGAEVITLINGNAFNAVLEGRLDQLNKTRQFFPIRFGYQAQTDADAIIETNARQVCNLPDDVTVVVVPVGSGVSGQGVLVGIRQYRPDVKVCLIQPFGYDRKILIPEGLNVDYFKGEYDYAKCLRVAIDDFQLDEIYEAKAYEYMRKKLTKTLAKERKCFWVIGDANGLR